LNLLAVSGSTFFGWNTCSRVDRLPAEVAMNLLERYPKARKTKCQGLFIIGRDQFLIQVKVDFHGSVVGYQGTFRGSFKEAIQAWKDYKKQCYVKAKAKWIQTMKQKLSDSNIKLFK
jgi:hypothetical protein